MEPTRTPSALLDQLVASTNAHDLDALVDCFAADYELTDPAHPVRSFTGAAQVRKNWAALFAAIPHIRLDMQQRVLSGDSFWLEGRQVGTRRDGQPLDNQMVFIAQVSADLTMTQLAQHASGRSEVGHIPRGALCVMSFAMRPIRPAQARMASAALLMDQIDLTFDPGPARAAQPWLPATNVTDALDAQRCAKLR